MHPDCMSIIPMVVGKTRFLKKSLSGPGRGKEQNKKPRFLRFKSKNSAQNLVVRVSFLSGKERRPGTLVTRIS